MDRRRDVSDFLFDDNDLVFVGEGPCGDAALEAVAASGAIAIMLCTEQEWRESGRTWISPLPEHMLFDLGNIPRSQRRLERLGGELSGLNLRIFLAGDIPPSTTFRPPAFVQARILMQGAAPRAFERRGFEKMSKRLGFTVSSLHEVAVPWDISRFPRLQWDPALAQDLTEARQSFHRELVARRRTGYRPVPLDRVTQATDSALAVSFIPSCESMIVRRWREGLFDTAYFGVALLEEYAKEGICRIIVENDVILLRQQVLFAKAAELGVELQPLDTRLYQ